MPDPPTSAQWLARAAEAKMIAESMRNAFARREMLEIAAGYERLARRAALAAERSATSDTDRD